MIHSVRFILLNNYVKKIAHVNLLYFYTGKERKND